MGQCLNIRIDGENPSSCLEPDMLKKYKNIKEETKKKKGRPIGSKNKKPKTSSRHLADPQTEDETFYDSGDVCNICEFPLNHPTKVSKPKIECKKYQRTVHKPCLEKYGEKYFCSI